MNNKLHIIALLTLSASVGAGFVLAEEPDSSKKLTAENSEEAASKEIASAAQEEPELTFEMPEEGAEGDAGSLLSEGSDGEIENVDGEDIFVLQDFVVSTEQDRGYHSAHTMGGTRTSALIKDTPMTIEVVNQQLMDDLNLNNIDDLATVLANVEVQGDTSYNNRAVVFRGLRTAAQLYEFMPRELDQDRYNVDRAEIIRGSNSLVYGQAAPGGKINFLAKRPMFNKDRLLLDFEFGQFDKLRYGLDGNVVVNDDLALRVMAVHKEASREQELWQFDYDAITLAATYKISDKTQVSAHIEYVDTFRRYPPNVNRDMSASGRTRLSGGATGAIEGAPATSEFVQYIPDSLKQLMIDYQDFEDPSNSFIGQAATAAGQPTRINRVPDFFKNEADIDRYYSALDVGRERMGEFISEDWSREKDGIFLMGDVVHQFSDELSLKVAAQHEQSNFDDRVRTGANNVRVSGGPFLNTTNNFLAPGIGYYYNSTGGLTYGTYDENTTEQEILDILGGAALTTGWNEREEKDDSSALRSTLSYHTEIGSSKQQFLFGIDFDQRQTDRVNRSLYYAMTKQNADGTIEFYNDPGTAYNPPNPANAAQLANWANKDRPQFIGEYDSWESFRAATGYQFQPSFFISDDPDDVLGGDGFVPEAFNFGSFYDRNRVQTDTRVYAGWLANQGTYFDGRLNTLVGIRYDIIEAWSLEDEIGVEGYGSGSPTESTFREISPTLGFLFWLNENVAFFANYSESIEAPTGFQRNIDGFLVDPELGSGFEGGFKFEFLDGKLNGTLIAFQTEKENAFEYPGNIILQEIYPWTPDAFIDDAPSNAYYENGVTVASGQPTSSASGGFSPSGFFINDYDIQVQGIELALFYNPTPEWSFRFNYGFLDTEITKHPLERFEGRPVDGEVPHSANLQARYEFKDGELKGLYTGLNFTYKSPGLWSTYEIKNDPNDVSLVTDQEEIWLGDQFEVGAFLGYRGTIGKGNDAPRYNIRLGVTNLFDDVELVATPSGGYRFTQPRTWTVSGSLLF